MVETNHINEVPLMTRSVCVLYVQNLINWFLLMDTLAEDYYSEIL